MAHKKAGSSSKNGRDSVGQRLGVKAGDGQLVAAGSIIVRQRGMTFLAGQGAGLGRDYTVFATVTGRVRFEHETKSKKRIRVLVPEAARADGAGRAPRAASRTALPAAVPSPSKAAAKSAARATPPKATTRTDPTTTARGAAGTKQAAAAATETPA